MCEQSHETFFSSCSFGFTQPNKEQKRPLTFYCHSISEDPAFSLPTEPLRMKRDRCIYCTVEARAYQSPTISNPTPGIRQTTHTHTLSVVTEEKVFQQICDYYCHEGFCFFFAFILPIDQFGWIVVLCHVVKTLFVSFGFTPVSSIEVDRR